MDKISQEEYDKAVLELMPTEKAALYGFPPNKIPISINTRKVVFPTYD